MAELSHRAQPKELNSAYEVPRHRLTRNMPRSSLATVRPAMLQAFPAAMRRTKFAVEDTTYVSAAPSTVWDMRRLRAYAASE